MASLVTRREMSLEVPKLLIAAAQPYQTLGGPALTTLFLNQPHLLPFQQEAFHHSSLCPIYSHVLLHTLAEFSTTPRQSRDAATRPLGLPNANFWRDVGVLNCFYTTIYSRPSLHPSGAVEREISANRDTNASRKEPCSSAPPLLHPVMGAVELVRPSHRHESDVKLTLFASDHRPVASVLMTGPSMSHAIQSGCGSGAVADRSPGAGSAANPLGRTPLPNCSPPKEQSGYEAASLRGSAQHGSGLPALELSGAKVNGGLYGDVVVISGAEGPSYAQRGYFWPAVSSADSSGELLPPWTVHHLVDCFLSSLQRSGFIGGSAGEEATSRPRRWWLCAHHVVQVGDLIINCPLEIVSATPQLSKGFRLPPWRQQIGLPSLFGESTCVALHVEVRQKGQVVSTGTFFYCALEEEEKVDSTS